MLICGAVGYALEVPGRICIAGKGALFEGVRRWFGVLSLKFFLLFKKTHQGWTTSVVRRTYSVAYGRKLEGVGRSLPLSSLKEMCLDLFFIVVNKDALVLSMPCYMVLIFGL